MHRPCSIYPVNTSVGSMYFFDFQHIKHMYMYNVFKIYMLYKRTLVVSDLVLARWGSESVFDRPWILLLSLVLTPQTIFFYEMISYVIDITRSLLCFMYYLWRQLKLLVYSVMNFLYLSSFIFCLVFSLSFWVLTLMCFISYRLTFVSSPKVVVWLFLFGEILRFVGTYSIISIGLLICVVGLSFVF